jgi:hypothetical protein
MTEEEKWEEEERIRRKKVNAEWRMFGHDANDPEWRMQHCLSFGDPDETLGADYDWGPPRGKRRAR